jgi:hypothetical protein
MEVGRPQIPNNKRYQNIQINIQNEDNITETSRPILGELFTNELQMACLGLKTVPMLQ